MTDTETPEVQDSFGKFAAKQFVITTAVTAGMLTGLFIVGSTMNAVKNLKAKRQAKKETAKTK